MTCMSTSHVCTSTACARHLCASAWYEHVISPVPDHNTDNGAPVTHSGGGKGGRGLSGRPRSGAPLRSLIASLKHASGSLMMLLKCTCKCCACKCGMQVSSCVVSHHVLCVVPYAVCVYTTCVCHIVWVNESVTVCRVCVIHIHALYMQMRINMLHATRAHTQTHTHTTHTHMYIQTRKETRTETHWALSGSMRMDEQSLVASSLWS